MRRIREVLDDGVKPEQVLAVVGAFHAPGARAGPAPDDGRGERPDCGGGRAS